MAQILLPPNFRPRTRLRLSEVERIIRLYRIIVPCPSRQTLIRLCEEGILETPTGTAARSGWEVYEDSFWKWAGYVEDET
ncbi:MAG: hypothetical protein IT174_10660 [Acidobacteria bacterium]|nr:hypothetical protein [Acidobacteriota bacterium]